MTENNKPDSFDSTEFSETASNDTVPGYFSILQKMIWVFVVLAGLYALYQVISLAWVCDDAFISFRYAKNFIDGNGFVFNVGETVEGYSNFLWTILIVGAMMTGFEPILFTQSIGFISYLSTFLILVYISIKLSKRTGSLIIVVPLAALAFMLQYDSQVWATSGLETAWVTALITLAFVLLILANSKKIFLIAGLVLILAGLSRPDMMIFYFMALPYIFLRSRKPGQNLVYYMIPLVIIFLPYWIIRFWHYGYFFPNAFYAKLAYLSWYTQGLIYLWTYVKTNYSLILMIPAAMLLVPRLVTRFRKHKYFDNDYERIWLLGLLFIIPFTFYLVRIGGDFMHARFLIPITPICFLILETTISVFLKKSVFRYILYCVIILTILFRWDQFPKEGYSISGIFDEHDSYKAEDIKKAKIDGARLEKYLIDKNVVLGFEAGQAKTIYYSNLPTAINYKEGLTDEFVAHIPIELRSRAGREKRSVEKYMAERKINFLTIDIGQVSPNRIGVISFDGTILPIIQYDAKLMEELKAYPEVEFIDFLVFLDDYISSFDKITTGQLQADFEQFKEYYFNFNDDPQRQNSFSAEIDKRMNQYNEEIIQ